MTTNTYYPLSTIHHQLKKMKVLSSILIAIAASTSAFAQSYISHHSLEGRATDPFVNSYLKQANGNLLVAAVVDDSVVCKPSNVVTYAESVVKNPGSSLTSLDASSNPIWTRNWLPTTYLNSFFYINHVTEDASQNIYVSGRFSGLVDMDPGSGVDTFRTTLNSAGAFIIKLDANGNYLWHRVFAGPANTYYIFWDLMVVLQANGALFCHGDFTNAIDADPGTGVATFTSNGMNEQSPIFIELDASGNYVSAIKASGTGSSSINKVEDDANGNRLALYAVLDALDVDLQGTTNLYTNNAAWYSQVLARYNSSKQLLWSTGLDTAISSFRFHVLPNGDFYVLGSLDTTGKLGTGAVHTISNGSAMFVEKWSASGTCVWSKAFNCKGTVWPCSITLQQGVLVGLYSFSDSLKFGAGIPSDMYASNTDFGISMFDTLGNHLSSSSIVSDSSSITYDSHPIFAGNSFSFKTYVYGNADLDPTTGQTIFTPHYATNNPCVFVTWTFNPPLSLMQTVQDNSILVTPNPATELLQVSGLPLPANVSIVDLSGKLVSTLTINANSDKLDITALPAGNYFLRSGSTSVRFVKH
jgi:hypothetical protein